MKKRVDDKEANSNFQLTDVQLAYLLGRNQKLYLGGNSTHFCVEVITELEPLRLQHAFNKVIQHQPMLRTIILSEGVQHTLSEVPEYEIEVFDIRDKTQEEQNAIIENKRELVSHKIFQLDCWPLFGFSMYRIADEKYSLIADFDMMIVDGLSIEIMLNEIIDCYYDEELELPEVKYTFRDYIEDRQVLIEQNRESDEKFWDEQVKKLPLGPELPVYIEEGKISRFKQKEYIVDAELWSSMKKKLLGKRIVPAMYLLATYAKMLSKFCNQTEFTINLTTTNRRDDVKNLSEVIGDFTEIIPVDVYFGEGKSIFEVAKESQKRLARYRKNSTIGGIQIMKKVSEYNQLASGVPFPVVFTSMLFDTAKDAWDKLGERVYQISQTPQVLLDGTVTERKGSLILRWDYLIDCFKPELIQEMFDYYVKELLNALNDVPIEQNNEDAWKTYNETDDVTIKDETLQKLFMENAKKFHDRTALVCGDKQITYGELDCKSNQIAALITEKYGTGRSFVLEAYREIDTVAWMLGILKAGGYYIPVETSWPENRKQYILENSGAAAIVDPLKEKIIESNNSQPEIITDNIDNLAYIIYTSGSTGAPKGVAITQSAVCNTIQDINRKFNITEKDVIIGISSFCFDLSVYDIFGALSAGAECVIMKDRTNVDEYDDILRKYPVSVWNSVPAILEMYVDNSRESCLTMKHILLSGDWIPLDLPEKAGKNFVNAEIISLGGATEASVWSIYYPIKKVETSWNSIPYGYPLSNQKIYVLDYEQELCPYDVDGEICIGGKGVAACYLNDEEKTNQHFYVHPKYGRIYRTGDFGCFSRDGYVIFKGRKDEQVKLHGYRVELGEIETKIKRYEGVQEAAVIVDNEKGQHLLGYIVPEKNDEKAYSVSAEEACAAAEKTSECYPEEISFEQYEDSLDWLDKAAIGIMAETFNKIGAIDESRRLSTIDEMISQKGVSEKYEKVLEQWMSVLKEKGLVVEKDGMFYIKEEAFVDIDKIFKDILDRPYMKYWQDFFEFVLLCRTNMQEILRAKVNPVNILFPNGDWTRAENYYRKNPIAEYHNRIVAKAIAGYAASKKECVRILEVGAGTGGTTYDVLKEIAGYNVEYTYTDLSTFFTEKAKERFAEYDFVRYGLYTIDKDPQAQGYGIGEYDVVIGANVLHDAANITESLGYLNRLIKKDGMLVLLETTRNRLIQKVSVGLIEGFSTYDDERKERKQPLLNVDEWNKSFAASGYGITKVYPYNGSNSEDFEQHIFIAVPEKQYVDVSIKDLLQYLRKELPSYMIPECMFVIDEIPLSSNGKVRKNLLPRYTSFTDKDEETIIEPANENEKLIHDVLADILNESRISVEQNLFEIGIDSLKAVSVVTKCKEAGISFSLVDLYTYPSIRELVNYISSRTEDQLNVAQKIDYKQYAVEPHYDYGKYELNEIQKAYLYGRSSAFELGNISTHYYVEIETNLDIKRLEQSFNKVIEHQSILRTVIYEDGTQQILEHTDPYRIQIVDVSGLEEQKQDEVKNELRKTMSHQMHEIGKWPMFELKAVKTGDGKYDLYCSLDVMIADGASILMMWNEIAACYNGKTLPDLKFHFSDYLESLHQLEYTEFYEHDKTYWEEKADNFPQCVPLPYRTAFTNVKKPHFRRLSTVLNKEEWESFKNVAKYRRVTPAALLCSAYSTVLAKYSNCSNFGINMTVYNRYPFYEQINDIMGDFTSTCILDIHAQKNIWRQTEEIQRTIAEGMEHRHYDGIKFIKQLSKNNGNPLAAVMPVIFTCALFEEDMTDLNKLGKIKYTLSQTSQAALDNQSTTLNGELVIAWDFVDQIFDEEFIEKMFSGYVELVRQIGKGANNPVLENGNVEELVAAYNKTEKEYTPVTLDWLFEQQVAKSPEAVAVIMDEQSVSYRELNSMANQVANYLVERNYTKRGVAVLGEKTIETVAAILGILKAGCFYIPASPDYPEARIKYIMENSGCEMLLNTAMIKKSILGKFNDVFAGYEHLPEEHAYIIYTSGSTGRPKGVLINHGAAANTILDINRRYNVGAGDRIIGLSSFSFDLSVYDVFGALSSGATLVLVQEYRDVKEVKKILREKEITFWNSVPAIMQMTAESFDDQEQIASLKHVLLSGDWIPLDLPEKVKKTFPNANVVSLGGATEASIWSIYYPIDKINCDWRSVPYGYPLDNQKFYVLDESGELCPTGVRGELYIGGIGLAEGYINNEEETTKRFIEHSKFGRIYRTGDYGIFSKEGYIEFLGRVDDQVKLHGYRIELEEISNTLKKHEKVHDALSIITEGDSKSVISYVIPEMSNDSEDTDLSSWNSAIKVGAENAEITPKEVTAARYGEVKSVLEDESLGVMLKTLRTICKAAFDSELENSVINIHMLIQKYGIREHYTKMIRQWFIELVRCGYAKEITRDVYQMADKETLENIPEGLSRIEGEIKEATYFEESLNFLNLCNENILRLLTGEETILNLLFPKGKWDVAKNLYQTNPIAEYYNRIIAETMVTFIQGKEDVKILETGAGIGGTTAAVLKRLKDEKLSYVYTDISTFFTDTAKTVYNEYEDKIIYDLFNINLSPQEQGYGLEQYDIILAANMLHDSQYLNVTLNNLRNMLKPNGMLIFLEQNRNTKLQMVTSAMIDGFSDYHDFRLKDNAPLLRAEQWMALLGENGFADPTCFPPAGSETELYGQSIIIGRKPGKKEFLTEAELNEVLEYSKEFLVKYMVPNRIIQLDSFPLSANGKVSKKLLPVPKTVSKNGGGADKPTTEMEKLLFEKWVTVLGKDDFGILDDFYTAGGDSLKAIQLITELNADKELDIRRFIDGASIKEIAEYLESENITIQ